MKQFYYTEEGTPYVLRTATKTIPSQVLPVDEYISLLAIVNIDGTVTLQPWQYIDLTTPKKIIPVTYNLSVIDNTTDPFNPVEAASISSPFFGYSQVNVNKFDHLSALTKLSACAEIIDFDDELHYHYGVKYGQAVFSDNDFISPFGQIFFSFASNMGQAMADSATPDSIGTVPAGTYQFVFTFMYFELQQ